eukprot:TRINITY_DN22851_c0_g1_i1.p1 TRINITY_DN22851_c0_g1~~TRINITY_DN22851_c0_g1_i1.p1  ORF type:complete len:184 (+),score=38.79 TRINITY_DN22851_c0_g1_i1:475-1026(+)
MTAATFEKIVIEFEGCFATQPSMVLCMKAGRDRQDFVRFCNYSSFCSQTAEARNVWLGYTAPVFARRMAEEGLSNDDVLETALTAMRAAFPDEILQVKSFELTRWGSDPCSLGSYSAQKVGCVHCESIEEDLLASTALMDGGLLLAGDYLAGDHIGCCHGAFMSGEAAAGRLLGSRGGTEGEV